VAHAPRARGRAARGDARDTDSDSGDAEEGAAPADAAEAALVDYLTRLDANYGTHETRRNMALSGVPLPGSAGGTLDELASFARTETARAPSAG
jgi:hypothetical protein